MNLDSKIYIAGNNGMVGSAIWRTLSAKGQPDVAIDAALKSWRNFSQQQFP